VPDNGHREHMVSRAGIDATAPPRVRCRLWSFRSWLIGRGASLLISIGAWPIIAIFIVVQNRPLESPAHGPWSAMFVIVLSAWGGFILWSISVGRGSVVSCCGDRSRSARTQALNVTEQPSFAAIRWVRSAACVDI
jgi:hypothetical protein